MRITRPVGFFLSARMPQRQSCNNPLKGPLSLSNGNEPSCRHTEYDHKSSQSRKQLKAPRKLSRDGRDLFVLSCSKDFSPFLFYFFLVFCILFFDLISFLCFILFVMVFFFVFVYLLLVCFCFLPCFFVSLICL